MLMKSIAAGLAGTALFATVAFAQTATTTDKAPTAATTTTTATSASGDWRTSKMDGLNVYNDANEKIGSISDLLMDKSGNVKLAVIGVGGFLGMGEHMVAIPFEKLKFVNQPVTTSSNTTTKSTTTTTGAATDRPAATTTTAPASSSTTSKWYPDHAVFNATKDELKAMPEFKYD